MLVREHLLHDNKKVVIVDDLFPSYLTHHFELFCQESKYKLGSTSNKVFSDRSKTFFQCNFYDDDLERFRFHEGNFLYNLKDYISPNPKDVDRSWIVCSSPFTQFQFHCDCNFPGRKSLLYYINREWNSEWGGETLFCNSSGECEFAVSYKPHRIVIFDSEIPHKSAALTTAANQYRFTYVMQMK